LPYYFQDAHAFVEHRFDSNSVVSVTAVASSDRINNEEHGKRLDIGWGNALIGTSFRHRILLHNHLDSIVHDHRLSASNYGAFARTRELPFNIDADLHDVRFSSGLTLHRGTGRQSFGFELSRLATDYFADVDSSWIRNLLLPGGMRSDQRSASVWYDNSFRIGRVAVLAGLRADAVEHASTVLLPRVEATLPLAASISLFGSAGEHAQWIQSAVREEQPVRPIDFWVGGPTVPMARSSIITLGIEHNGNNGFQVRAEAFTKRFDDLAERSSEDKDNVSGDEFTRIGGTSSGVDLLLRHRAAGANGIEGWIAYTFSSSVRVDQNGTRFMPAHDRRHELNAVASKPAGAWSLSGRFNLASGSPYTFVEGVFYRRLYDPLTGRWSNGSQQYLANARNSARYTFAHRLDLSITRTGRNGDARTTPYLSIANIYGAQNPWMYYFDYSDVSPQRIGLSNFRFLPTIGVRHAF
jgi:hypothetical protein